MDIQKLRRAAKREYDRLVNDGPDGAWLELGGVTFRVGCLGDLAENPRTARKYGLDR